MQDNVLTTNVDVIVMNSEKLNILRLLIENPEKEFSIRQTALKRKINYKSAYNAIFKLKKENIVDVKKHGNTSIVKFNFNFNESVYLAESRRMKDFLKNKDFKILYRRLKEIKNPFFICVVFGSYAKGKAQKGSDLDLCVITNDKKVSSEIHTVLDITPFEIHYIEFTPEEFIEMLKTTEFNVGKEIVKNRVILKGIEDFYELMNYVK